MSTVTPLYFLSGPTASGKTGLAHRLAERMQARLLSVDSMMVYREMDIGTAKPTAEEISRYDYAGLNLTDPGKRFSTGNWLREISRQLDSRPTLAVGGTGLYFRALIDGLPGDTPGGEASGDPSVQVLREQIRQVNPQVLEELADPWNPRRLERALQWLKSGQPPPRSWGEKAAFPVAVLRRPVEELNQRIRQRVEEMFQQGLLEETAALQQHGCLTGTAAQAIGYREALSVIRGEQSREQAGEALATRTRRYAKRQRTWFRNQMDSRWVDVEKEENADLIADKITMIWQDSGSFAFDRSLYV